jgi:hypothetical protein
MEVMPTSKKNMRLVERFQRTRANTPLEAISEVVQQRRARFSQGMRTHQHQNLRLTRPSPRRTEHYMSSIISRTTLDESVGLPGIIVNWISHSRYLGKMTTATVKPEDGLREPPSLMCLPPEIRVVIYGFAVEDHLNTLITAPASSEPCFFAPGYQDKPNSCLGALALIHTSKTISIESHDAMQAVVIRRQHAFDCDRYSFHEAFDRQPESKIKESDDLVTRLDKEWRKLEEFGHQLEHMVFVKRTLKYTRLELDFEYRRAWASNDKNAICGNSSAKDVESQCFESEKAGKTDRRSGERHGFAATTTASEDSAEIKADAGLTASITADIEAKLPVICEGVQNRLAAGAGVRESLKTQFFGPDWRVTHRCWRESRDQHHRIDWCFLQDSRRAGLPPWSHRT